MSRSKKKRNHTSKNRTASTYNHPLVLSNAKPISASNSKDGYYKRALFWIKSKAKWIISIGSIIAFVFVILGYLNTVSDTKENIEKLTTSEHEKFINEQYITGVLIPEEIQAIHRSVFLRFGNSGNNGYSVSMADLKKGLKVTPNYITCGNGKDNSNIFNLNLQLENNRVKITTDFYNSRTEAFVAHIEKNKIMALEREITNYDKIGFNDNNTFFEAIDNFNQVIFSIKFEYPNIISILGYFVGPVCSTVINDEGLTVSDKTSSDYKVTISKAISKIKRRGQYNN